MKYLLSPKDINLQTNVGGKAANLKKLVALGYKVPKWVVLSQDFLSEEVKDKVLPEYRVEVPQEILGELSEYFGNSAKEKTFAVRSSAVQEDGEQHSFAGQFESFLHVPFNQIREKIKAVWLSANSDRVKAYRTEKGLAAENGMAVLIQEMVEGDVSGVAFGVDPVLYNTDKKVVSAVFGLGEGLVSGDLNADTFTVSKNGIDQNIVQKTHAFVKDSSQEGCVKQVVPIEDQQKPSLVKEQIEAVCQILDELEKSLGEPQDVEFTYAKGELYLLQTRPITTKATTKQGEYILWDNSNIIESYPGITTPLTFSFILKMYEQVYRQFSRIMGVRQKDIETHASVFANTLGLVRGRVYYNLLNWYKMLAMLPGYSINAENMERMMGVKERFELKEDYQMSKGLAWFRTFSMLVNMLRMQVRLPRDRKKFVRHLNKVMDEYNALNFGDLKPKIIIEHYQSFEQNLLLQWKAPLVNDFFAMIWFGMLQKQTTKYAAQHPNIHNDLLCGSQDIISTQPIHRSIELAALVVKHKEAHKLFESELANKVWDELKEGAFPEIKGKIDEYINSFGERCVGELKLETVSYSQNPALFVRVIQAYVSQGITKSKSHNNIEDEIRLKAEKHLSQSFKRKPIKRWWFNVILNKTRDLVSNRENLRYQRTRGFGMVRNMFNAIGMAWFKEGLLDSAADVFYLELPEIVEAAEKGFNHSYYDKIQMRKQEFGAYREQLPPMERFFTYGNSFTDDYIYSLEKVEGKEMDLEGIGCCPGVVQGKVCVVTNPGEISSLNGDILVTSSTDPGWVTLFPTAGAILVERGSLLSHSAIVSREMGIPCIVGVSGLLRSLKTGDKILMDGSTGKISVLEYA